MILRVPLLPIVGEPHGSPTCPHGSPTCPLVNRCARLKHHRPLGRVNRPSAFPGLHSSAGRLTDAAAEELWRSHLGAALFTLDLEGGREGRRALGTAMPQLAPAVRARTSKVALELEEVPLSEAAAKAERHVVPEGLPSLLLDPVSLWLTRCVHRCPAD